MEPVQEIGSIAQTMADGLGRLDAPLFDWQYISAQVIYHYAAFYRYERESIHGRGKQLRDLAAQAFRDVKEHHHAARLRLAVRSIFEMFASGHFGQAAISDRRRD